MSTILLADDSPHAQRMGERILQEEGYSVALAADGDAALARLGECDPDVVIADMFLPGWSGFDLCALIKEAHPHIRVMLTAGLLEPFEESQVRQCGCDAVLHKPFEASVMSPAVRDLAEAARQARQRPAGAPVPLPDQIQARVAAAVQAELPRIIEEITRKVLNEWTAERN
jgi:CheY-like chemotaxis protein